MAEERLSFTETVERYRQTLVFNNDLLKKDYPERYEFNTKMQVEKMQKLRASTESITAYETRRTKNYDKKFKVYCDRLDVMVEPAVRRYVSNIRAAFGYD